MTWRRCGSWTVGVLAGLLGLTLLPTAARASAGLKPSEAPLVAVGQHYFGNISHAYNAGFQRAADLWRLPPLLTSDAITVAWNATGPSLCLAQDVDDYSWGESLCNGSSQNGVSGSGSARSVINVKSATSAGYLEFLSSCCGEPGSYDFTVESIQHAIGVGLAPKLHMRTSAVLTASANLSNGLAVPDGLTFYLTATWGKTGSAQYSATSGGGSMSFPVSLPPETISQTVTFTVTRPVDAQYLAAKSAALKVKVARPKTEPPVRHRHCRRGFHKRRVHGHVRCVPKRHHHRH